MATRVGVIGSGLIGKSWGVIFLRAGCSVNFYDSEPKCLETVEPWIQSQFTELSKANLLSHSQYVDLRDNLSKKIKLCTTLQEALEGVEWVQECVPEFVEAKREIFSAIDKVVSDKDHSNTIFASSSSAIKPSQFVDHLEKIQTRTLVAHPINPPHVVPLVEVVPHPKNLKQTIDAAMNFLEKMGQTPILVKKEINSFIVNRLQGAVLNEALKLIEGDFISVEDLDKTFRDGLGLRWSFMGPMETIDLNAPEGIADYCKRYGPTYSALEEEQAKTRAKWSGNLVDEMEKQRREFLSKDQLSQRAQWRNTRLMELMRHKQEMIEKEQNISTKKSKVERE